MDGAALPLRLGDAGDAVLDLQRRLARAGFHTCIGDAGSYGAATVEAVRQFQGGRGLRAGGICGQQTWSALVEAGHRLGDRLLYHRSPMLRGDDVAHLQGLLGRLGFLADRIDGIFGPRTAGALLDFQRNTGLTTDGICGPETVAALRRLGERSPGEVKAGVVERERLRSAPRALAGRRLVVGEYGGLSALATAVAKALQDGGAVVVRCDHPDGSQHASEANAFEAELYLGLQLAEDPGCTCAFYGTPAFRSGGGHHLAELIADAVSRVLGRGGDVRAMQLPVLRETRMPAALCELGDPATVVQHTAALADAVARAVGHWIADPVGG